MVTLRPSSPSVLSARPVRAQVEILGFGFRNSELRNGNFEFRNRAHPHPWDGSPPLRLICVPPPEKIDHLNCNPLITALLAHRVNRIVN